MKFKNLLLMLLVIGMGCTPSPENTPAPSSTEAPTSSPTPPTLDTTRRTALEIQYELLRQTQTQIADVWQGLQSGQTVTCATTVAMPFSPSAISGSDPISQHLFQTALALQDAVSLWAVECQNPRSQPPPDVIERGVLAALAAGDSLRLVQELLATPD